LGIKQSVNESTLSRANESHDWCIFAGFGAYLINLVQPLYANTPVPHLEMDNDIFVLDSTTNSLSLTLWSWARGKRSRGAIKVHTFLDLRGNMPTFIYISDGKYHDVNVLDEIEIIPNVIYVMDKAYVDFRRLYTLNEVNSFFVVRANLISCNWEGIISFRFSCRL
jgi:hypothetical protein